MNELFLCFLLGMVAFVPGLGSAQTLQNAVIAPHAKDLVVLKGEDLAPFKPDRFLQAPYIVLYFGAGWCPDCRRFSPSLVAAYARQAPPVKQFEVLLLSRDKTAEGMLKFMRTEKMRWPALAYEKVAGAQDLSRFYSGHGIPCLTVIDAKGTVVLQSKSDQDAKEVLQQFEDLLKNQRAR